MSDWNWQLYQSDYSLTSDGPVLVHEIYSRNGAYGECIICFDSREEKPYFIIAGGNDTGRLWKSPDETYSTIDEAKQAAERTWKPILRKDLLNGSKENRKAQE
jgi:hypothetical protein